MRINTNVAVLTAIESNKNVNMQMNNSLEKLSTGLRINKASDDASGLAIADKLRTQATSNRQAIDNGNSAVALLQIGDKAMSEQSNILDIVKQKLIQAATATTSDEGREAIRKDIQKLLTQLNNISSQTNYNGIYLLQGSNADDAGSFGLNFQMGELSSHQISLDGNIQANTTGLGLDQLLTAGVLDADTARAFMGVIDSSIDVLNGWRADIGSTQNQIESSVRNLMTQETNIKAAESVIRDVDYAQESSNFSRLNIISQAGTYAISQANQIQQNVLKLLQ